MYIQETSEAPLWNIRNTSFYEHRNIKWERINFFVFLQKWNVNLLLWMLQLEWKLKGVIPKNSYSPSKNFKEWCYIPFWSCIQHFLPTYLFLGFFSHLISPSGIRYADLLSSKLERRPLCYAAPLFRYFYCFFFPFFISFSFASPIFQLIDCLVKVKLAVQFSILKNFPTFVGEKNKLSLLSFAL